MHEEISNRYIYIDFLKIIAFFAIVVVHTTTVVIEAPSDGSDYWQRLTYLNAAMRFTVPIFILCSGAMILRKPIDDIKHFFWKRFSRVVIPFVFWGIIYEIFANGVTNPLNIAQDFYFHKVSFHFWFIYMILVAYLFAPILADVVRKLSQQKLYYILGLWIFFSCIISFGFLIVDRGIIGLYRLSLFVGYFIAGYMIHNQKIFSLKLNWYKLLIISASIVVISAWLINSYTPTKHQFYDLIVSPYTILIIIWSLMIFQYFREHESFFTSRPRLRKFISKVSALTYGAYLVHIFWREYLKDFFFVLDGTFYAGNYSILWHILFALVTFLLSFLLVAIFYNIPYLRRLV